MKLEKIAGPLPCQGGTCPTIYASDRDTIVVQGYIIEETTNAELGENESLVEIPRALLELLAKS